MKSERDRDAVSDILEAIPQSMFLLDKDKYIISIYNINPDTLAGFPVDKIVGKHLDVFSKDPQSPFYQVCSLVDKSFDTVFASGVSEKFQYQICETHLEAIVTKLSGERILTQVRDITSTENHIYGIEQKNRNELEFALRAGGITSWIYHVPTKMFTSTNGNNVIGESMSYDMLIGLLYSDEDRDIVHDMFDRMIDKGEKWADICVKVQNNTGSYQWSHVNAMPNSYDENGQVNEITGSQKDVTKEYEDAREKERDRLKLEMATRTAGAQQWEYDVASDQFVMYLGSVFQVGEFSSSELRQLIHPDDVKYFESEFSNMFVNQEVPSILKMRIFAFNKSYRWYQTTASVFEKSKNGEVGRIIGLITDITAQVEVTNELIELRDKAEESNRLKSAFLANMSHEIRTPLNAIVGFSALLLEAEDETDREEYLRIIEQNNELLLTLINDILDLSKIEAGKIEFIYSLISINDLLRKLQQSTQLKARPNVTVVLNSLPSELKIVSDVSRLTQVIANFLNNAVKFTTEGTITLGCNVTEEGFRFFVRDTGTGICEEDQKSIFGRFVKLNNFAQGSGLGLSISETIVLLLKGKIGVTSELGKGSEFWCVIPSRKDENVPLTPDYLLNTHALTEQTGDVPKGKIILIAEDNPNNYALYERMLSDYNLVHAWNGNEALHLLQLVKPDIILMDLKMPDVDGFEATDRIRKIDNNIPIIAVSASVMPEDKRLALHNGFSDFIAKPINVIELTNVIKYYLAN